MSTVERAVQNYVDGSRNLEARAAIWRYSAPGQREVPDDWFVGLIDWPPNAVALDVGCGSGRFTQSLRRLGMTVALDQSLAMAGEVAAQGNDAVGCADVCALPLRDASIDVALAAWMLYHARDIDQACAELRRVVRPGGALIAVTNGARHILELDEILDEAAQRAGVVAQRTLGGGRFSFDEAAFFLSRWFPSVTMHVRRRRLEVPSVDPVVAYLASISPAGPESVDRLLAEVRSVATERLERDGSVIVTGLSAAFVCR